jgi:hypothetical protein
MPTNPPSAAEAIFGHLPRAEQVERTQRNTNSIGQAMWPSLGPQPKPPTNPQRESLLRGLRELNEKIDARLQRERGR